MKSARHVSRFIVKRVVGDVNQFRVREAKAGEILF